ncbi:MAG TPA: AAA family ATPase, partial [Anaerolineae bacterium]|nr:AAA family ATPase [Anaerolineae bacterium]
AQYAACRRTLAEGLGVEPVPETVALFEAIREGALLPAAAPSYGLHAGDEAPTAVFVARERELARLEQHLALALAGQAGVALVAGEAGSGKTALLAEFARRAMEQHADLVVASGSCNAQTGLGDPYLPFRDILGMLTACVEAQRAGGAISAEQARRLWALLPAALEALVKAGPGLVGLLVPGEELLARAYALGPAWLPRLGALEALLQRQAADPPGLEQADLYEQVRRVLGALARQCSLLLLFDDLQWIDDGSLSLLFHLARRLPAGRLLIVGAYRPADVAHTPGVARHPLAAVVNELRRSLGDIVVDLNAADSRRFVDAYLDSRPNDLGDAFRTTLYRHTAGQPLFTVELLSGMQERGDLQQDEVGRWIEGPALAWDRLPPRVEAVIAERIGRLPVAWQAALVAASVEGEEFTAEVVARVQGVSQEEAIGWLSGPLGRVHHLVQATSRDRLVGQPLSRYRFCHTLFQRYLYNRLDAVERARLHQVVGEALEALYGPRAGEVAIQLGRHFEIAGLPARAIGYLLQAGQRAVRLSAYEAAIGLFTRGLALLEALPESPERSRQELELFLALGTPLMAGRGWGAPQHAQSVARAYALCRQAGTTEQLLQAMFLLADQSRAQGEHRRSLELGHQYLRLATSAGEAAHLAPAHWTLGETHFFLGRPGRARHHLEQALALYDHQMHGGLTALCGPDLQAACRSWLAWELWVLGYADQALAQGQLAVRQAQELAQPFSLAFALAFGGATVRLLRREDEAAQPAIEALAELVAREGLVAMQVWAAVFQGWEQARQGQPATGIAAMRQGVEAWRAAGAVTGSIFQLQLLAEACRRSGRAAEGLGAVDEALALVERTGERCCEAELHRLRGELLAQAPGAGPGVAREARACLRRAIEVARRQGARGWELRATMSLARLLDSQGRRAEAQEMLAAIYGWFTEGFDTADLREARALLDTLRS